MSAIIYQNGVLPAVGLPVFSFNHAMNTVVRFDLLSKSRDARIREESGIQSISTLPIVPD
jgi:hypothetical protein